MKNGDSRAQLKIFTCQSGLDFAQRVVQEINEIYRKKGLEERIELGRSTEEWFPDGEVKSTVNESVRGCDVYLIQLLQDRSFDEEDNWKGKRSVNDNFMALLTATDAIDRARPHCLTIVSPYFAYARQERRKGREPVSTRLMADLYLAAGAKDVFTFDIHNEAIENAFKECHFDNLRASPVLIERIRRELVDIMQEAGVGSPDYGGSRRADYYASKFEKENAAIGHKARKSGVKVEVLDIIGKVSQRMIYVDDIVSTSGTIKKITEASIQRGTKEVYVVTTHGILDPPAEEILVGLYDEGRGPLKRVFITDTVRHSPQFLQRNSPWLSVVSVAELTAQAIYRNNHNISVSELLEYHPK